MAVPLLNTMLWCLHGRPKPVLRRRESGHWVTWCHSRNRGTGSSNLRPVSLLPDATSAPRDQRLNCNERSQHFTNYQICNAYFEALKLRHLNSGNPSLPFLLTTNLRLRTLLHFTVCISHAPTMTQNSARRPRLSSSVPKIWFRWRDSQAPGDCLLNNALP